MFHIWCFLIHCTFKDPINDRYWGAYCNKLVFYVKYGQKILSKQVNEDNV